MTNDSDSGRTMKGGDAMTKTYTTISGDTWDIVAYKVFGDERYMDKIIKANMQHRETVIFPAGVTLQLPEVEARTPAGLPPWKKRGKV